VSFTDNSRGRSQSPPGSRFTHQNLCSSVATPPNALIFLRCPSVFTFLIANLELEFRVSPIRITDLRFSNRKFFAISCLAFQPSSTHIHTSAASSFSVQRRASSLQNLIETPRLEFRATPTKQSSLPISNRDKNTLFAPQMPAMVGIPRSTLVVSLSLTQETQ
jgi:hypothetical protein